MNLLDLPDVSLPGCKDMSAPTQRESDPARQVVEHLHWECQECKPEPNTAEKEAIERAAKQQQRDQEEREEVQATRV